MTTPETTNGADPAAHGAPTAPRVLVIGATGILGRPVVRVLAEAGLDVACLVRDEARAQALLPDGVRLLRGDLRDRASVEAALDGVDAVYLSLSNAMATTRPDFDPDTDGTRLVVDLASARPRSPRVLRLSAMAVEQAADDWWVSAAKKEADDHLEASGLDWTVFRPTWFMEGLSMCAVGPVLLKLPLGATPVRWIAAEDYGRMVLAALRGEGDVGRGIVRVQGPEPMTFGEASKVFLEVWRGRLIGVPLPRMAMRLAAPAAPPMHYLDHLLDYTERYVAKEPARVEGNDLAEPRLDLRTWAEGLRDRREFPSRAPF